MPNFANRVKNKVVLAAGSRFWREYLVTSSNITTSEKQLTSAVVGGDVIVREIVLQTDSTGLATGTNFQIGVNGQTYGPNLPLVETVANLGASVVRHAPHSATFADTTNDTGLTVSAMVPFVLEAGDNLTYSNSGAAGTGAGIVLIAILFERVHDGADVPDPRRLTVS